MDNHENLGEKQDSWYNTRMNILLIGARASGKTTLGRAVATTLRRRFVDLDDLTLAQFSETTVSDVWARHGEAAWRRAEVDALGQVLKNQDQIIALGGGTPLITDAYDLIENQRHRNQSRCIYLHCDGVELARRLSATVGDRPSLTGMSPAEEIAEVARQREGRYRAVADAVLDVTTDTPDEAAAALLDLIAKF